MGDDYSHIGSYLRLVGIQSAPLPHDLSRLIHPLHATAMGIWYRDRVPCLDRTIQKGQTRARIVKALLGLGLA